MNKTSAKEWLRKSWHHLSSASLLLSADHYLDIIAVEIHYSVEISLKSLLAAENLKIIKTHDLIEIYKHIQNKITFTEAELTILDIISEYHRGESYPIPSRTMPDKNEITQVIEFAEQVLKKICEILEVDKKEITGDS